MIDEDVINVEEKTSPGFLGVNVSYSLAVTAVILLLFTIYRGGFKGGVWQSLDKESQQDESLRSNREHIQYSTAVELKNGFVQVLSLRHSLVELYYSNFIFRSGKCYSTLQKSWGKVVMAHLFIRGSTTDVTWQSNDYCPTVLWWQIARLHYFANQTHIPTLFAIFAQSRTASSSIY